MRGRPPGERGKKAEKTNASGFRIPSIFMVPVGLGVGWLVASWPGAVFGGVIGVFLWRSRA